MKILHVMWTLGVGGIERLVLDLATLQRDRGDEPSVLVANRDGEFAQAFEAANIAIIEAGVTRGYQPPVQHNRRIAETMRAADIIHMHAFNPFFARLARLSNTPVIYTDHGNNALGRRKSLSEYITFPLRDRFMVEGVGRLTFNSHHTLRAAAQRLELSKVQHSVVYNGIDFPMEIEAFDAESLDLPFDPQSTFVIGTTGRFVELKGIDRLIKAFALLEDREDSILMLVGDGPKRDDLEAMVEQYELGKRVVFTGYQTPVAPYQAAMDVFAVPSVVEPFGLVAAEALAKGKPTLVMRDGGGLVEIIEPLEPLDIVDDVEALSDRLSYYFEEWKKGLLGDPAAVEARLNRAKDFHVTTMADAFDRLYRGLAEGARASR